MTFRFSAYDLDSATGELHKSGVRIKLGGQPIDVLTLLVQRQGALVTRAELKELLWTQELFTDFDHGVNTAIQRIRRALGDSAQSPHFIETIPRKGYRFCAPVTAMSQQTGSSRGRVVPPWAATALAWAMAAVLAMSWSFGSQTDPPRRLKLALAPGEEVHDAAISPDGLRVAYVTLEDGGLWIRDLAEEQSRGIPGSEGARRPTWSRDSRSVVFGAGDSLWRIAVDGSEPPQEICKIGVSY